MKLPRELLGLSPKQGRFYFKVADGIEHPNDIMDYYISGVSLPLGDSAMSIISTIRLNNEEDL